jgi:hypothetical protein
MNECSICLDQCSHHLSCNHFTCVDCLKRLVKKSNICPLCRKEFDITPYKYIPPTHKPNLVLSLKMKKKLNKFLGNRYLLNSKSNKDRKYFASLMVAYHEYVYVNDVHICKYINDTTLQELSKYELLRLYIFFNTTKIYSDNITNNMSHEIEMIFCCPQYHDSYTFLTQMSSLLSSSP